MKIVRLGLLLSSVITANAFAKEPELVPIGDWLMIRVLDLQPEDRPGCAVFHKTDKLTVLATVSQTGRAQFGVWPNSSTLTPTMFQQGTATVRFDDRRADIVGAAPFERVGGIILTGRAGSDGQNSLVNMLASSSRVEVRGPDFEASVAPSETARAVRLTYECARMLAQQGTSVTGDTADLSDSNGYTDDDADTGASEDQAEAERVFSNEQTPEKRTSEADRLGQAMGAMAGQSPTFALYRCAFSVSQFTGILPINGKDDHGTLTLSIAEDGSGEMNGGRFQPVYADGSVANGNLRSVAYRVSDITAATNRSPEHAAPPLLNMTESEMAAYRFGMKYMQGLSQQMMAGRQRYMTVSLADDVVRFLDLTPQNQAANIATLECFRTQ